MSDLRSETEAAAEKYADEQYGQYEVKMRQAVTKSYQALLEIEAARRSDKP